MTMVPPGGPPTGGPPAPPQMPQRGAFAVSEVLPLIQAAAERKRLAHVEYQSAAADYVEAKAAARKARADLIVRLRVFGNDSTGGEAIRTSAERQEWADADPGVQTAERDADVALELKRAARMAWEDADAEFQMLRTMLGMERDENRMHADRGDG